MLGGLLLDNSSWDKVGDLIVEADFYRHDHRLIYRHISKLIERNKPADVITVAESLENSAELQNAGGLAYLGALAQNTPSAANIRRYAEIVRDRSVLRRLAAVATEIADSAYNPLGREAVDLLNEAEAKVFHITEALQAQGFPIQKAAIRMPHGPLKQVGDYNITVVLHSDVTANITVSVLGES